MVVSENEGRIFLTLLRDLLEHGSQLENLRRWLAWQESHEFAGLVDGVQSLPVKSRQELRRALSIGQIESKLWLIDLMRGLVVADRPLSVCVVGGWCGMLPVLLALLKPFPILKVAQVDLDANANTIADRMNSKLVEGHSFRSFGANALEFDYRPYQVIINTSCEHFSVADLAEWIGILPSSRYLFVQSNDYFAGSGHVACHRNMHDFRKTVDVRTLLYCGEYELEKYRRFMVAGITHYNH